MIIISSVIYIWAKVIGHSRSFSHNIKHRNNTLEILSAEIRGHSVQHCSPRHCALVSQWWRLKTIQFAIAFSPVMMRWKNCLYLNTNIHWIKVLNSITIYYKMGWISIYLFPIVCPVIWILIIPTILTRLWSHFSLTLLVSRWTKISQELQTLLLLYLLTLSRKEIGQTLLCDSFTSKQHPLRHKSPLSITPLHGFPVPVTHAYSSNWPRRSLIPAILILLLQSSSHVQPTSPTSTHLLPFNLSIKTPSFHRLSPPRQSTKHIMIGTVPSPWDFLENTPELLPLKPVLELIVNSLSFPSKKIRKLFPFHLKWAISTHFDGVLPGAVSIIKLKQFDAICYSQSGYSL